MGTGVKGQFGEAEYAIDATYIGIEAKTGLGGGGSDVTVLSEGVVHGKVGPLEADVKVGASVSLKDGASAEGKVSGGVGPAKRSITLDKDGLTGSGPGGPHKDATVVDTRIGVGAKLGVGVGVKINVSQAGRAWDKTVQSVQNLGAYLIQRFTIDLPYN